ncbi:MAG: FG-GAP-like repeat-containing protein, partial [Planctomycetota bacterium]
MKIQLFIVLAVCMGVRGLQAADCNANRIEDADDLSSGHSLDCNENGVPDECDVAPPNFGAGNRVFSRGRPKGLATADLDRDGFVDLVVGNERTNGVSVLQSLGNGLFDYVEIDDRERRRADAVATGDLDGDGSYDIAVADREGVSIFTNDGDGNFQVTGDYEVPGTVWEAHAHELSGDGRDDVVVIHDREERLTFLMSRGDQTPELSTMEIDRIPGALGFGDIEGDGDLDIFVLSLSKSKLLPLINNGSGDFLPGPEIEVTGRRLGRVYVHDWTGDGYPDIATTTSTTAVFLVNDGSGGFEVRGDFPIRRVLDIAPADVDSDGHDDLTFGTFQSGIQVLLWRDDNFKVLTRLGPNTRTHTMRRADFDGDGDVDLAGLTSFENDADFVATFLRSSGSLQLPIYEQRDLTLSEPHWCGVADLDGDGDLDVVSVERWVGRLDILLNNGDGELEFHAEEFVAGRLITVTVADVDGDGDVDVIAPDQESSEIEFFLNDGNANFTPSGTERVGAQPQLIEAADLDEDGVDDLITANVNGRSISILLRRGDGYERLPDIRVGSGPIGVDSGDLNSDGHLDVVVANEFSSELTVLFGDGTGGLGDEQHYDVRLPTPGEVADLDDDGHPDFVVSSGQSSAGEINILWNRGDGTFTFADPYPLFAAPYSATAGDLDGDGLLDIVGVSEFGHNIALLVNTGDRQLELASTYPIGRGPRWAGVYDLDNDGDHEIVVGNRQSNSVSVLKNTDVGATLTHVESVCTEVDFLSVSTRPSGGAVDRLTKFVTPAKDSPDLLPTVYQNARRFELHEEFLREAFPDRFGAMTPGDYDALVGRRETRNYFVGVLYRFPETGGLPVYAFSVLASFFDDRSELPTVDEVRSVHERLQASFPLAELVYFPDTTLARDDAIENWPEDPGFPTLLENPDASLPFLSYTRATSFGRVRVLTTKDFFDAESRGGFSFQDILVLDIAPRDIEGVVAGIVTATPQGELSHLAIRTARRGTPNAYVKNAHEAFADLDGELIRLEVLAETYAVRPATAEEVDNWWAENRPTVSELPEADRAYRTLATLDEISALETEDALGPPIESRFGGKASNFARLQTLFRGEFDEYREVGFAIPLAHYFDFLERNSIASLHDERRPVSYRQFLDEALSDERFASDSTFRFESLARLRDAMRKDSDVPAALVRSLATKIALVFGDVQSPVRFRSSSNVEDAPEFNGAGLYNSTSACAADDLDLDDDGPSRCSSNRNDERGIARALRLVWASLWNFRAFEERSFYGIPQHDVGMGILVSRAFTDEASNGVAFTGNPSNIADRRYVITAQPGEVSVVHPDPGV